MKTNINIINIIGLVLQIVIVLLLFFPGMFIYTIRSHEILSWKVKEGDSMSGVYTLLKASNAIGVVLFAIIIMVLLLSTLRFMKIKIYINIILTLIGAIIQPVLFVVWMNMNIERDVNTAKRNGIDTLFSNEPTVLAYVEIVVMLVYLVFSFVSTYKLKRYGYEDQPFHFERSKDIDVMNKQYEELVTLKRLCDNGVITEQEYIAKKTKILGE